MVLASSVGQIYAAFEDMRIKHARLENAQHFYTELRRTKQLSPRSPKKFGTLFAPSQSGKSTTIKHYIETVVAREAIERGLFPEGIDLGWIADNQKVVLHVTLSPKANIKSLATDILTALGDPHADKGTQASLLRRVYDQLRYCGTELVFVDEIQHLSHKTNLSDAGSSERSGLPESTEVTDALKTMLIRGVVPMLFVGIPLARHFVFNDKQLAGRCLKEVEFDPLDFQLEDNRKVFFKYCGQLGLKLQKDGLFEEASDFVQGDIPAILHEVSGGLLGMVSNLVCQACVLAYGENSRRVTREHLAEATDPWAIPMRVIDYNPFKKGIISHKLGTSKQRKHFGR